MKIREADLNGIKIIEPYIFEDNRGLFFETYNKIKYSEFINKNFMQINESISMKRVLHGLYIQLRQFS